MDYHYFVPRQIVWIFSCFEYLPKNFEHLLLKASLSFSCADLWLFSLDCLSALSDVDSNQHHLLYWWISILQLATVDFEPACNWFAWFAWQESLAFFDTSGLGTSSSCSYCCYVLKCIARYYSIHIKLTIALTFFDRNHTTFAMEHLAQEALDS